MRSKTFNDGAQEKASIEEAFLQQISTFKREAKHREDKLKSDLQSAHSENEVKGNLETTVKFKLAKLKEDNQQ